MTHRSGLWAVVALFTAALTTPLAAEEPKLRATLKGHELTVLSVASSPDGKILASADAGGTIRLWDTATDKELAVLKEHTASVRCVRFSPNGKVLASAGMNDKTVRLWDVSTGKELAILKGHQGPVEAVAFNPDGKTVASGSHDRTVRIWDVATGKQVTSISGDYVCTLAYSPDGKTLAWGATPQEIKLWDVATGKERTTLKGNMTYVRTVAFTPDSKTLAAAGSHPTQASGQSPAAIQLWDVATGKELAPLTGHTAGADRLVQSGRKDGGLGECGQDGAVVGCRDEYAARFPEWKRIRRHLQRQWQVPSHGRRGQDGQTMGHLGSEEEREVNRHSSNRDRVAHPPLLFFFPATDPSPSVIALGAPEQRMPPLPSFRSVRPPRGTAPPAPPRPRSTCPTRPAVGSAHPGRGRPLIPLV
jgi:hypothetical protein